MKIDTNQIAIINKYQIYVSDEQIWMEYAKMAFAEAMRTDPDGGHLPPNKQAPYAAERADAMLAEHKKRWGREGV